MAERVAVACVVATIAFWTYTQTLLPGVDLGDTGGFQAAVLWPEVSARQAYPLYYNLARPFVLATDPGNPARALNLFSALCAAVAVGLLAYLASAIARSLASGIIAGLLLAFSYTFWSQAIIAEVYALHLALIAACLIALHHYAQRPTTARLAAFFAIYALSFGNHLSMVLFLPSFALFLLLVSPERRALFRPAIVGLAVVLAVAGALQYWPNFAAVAFANDAPPTWAERFAAFWFDTTKADWRETMVFGIRDDQALDRIAMWWFDARQQFGAVGIALAVGGATRLWMLSHTWGVLVFSAFAVTTVFALTYNVGDSHVFFLPSHLLAALCAGLVLAPGGGRSKDRPLQVLGIAAIAFCAWRGYSTWPAVDRHDDRRGEQLIARLTGGIRDPDAMLVSQMNWQLENVLLYASRYGRSDLTWTRMADVLPHFPFFVADQRAIQRDIVLTAEAAAEMVRAYGWHYPILGPGEPVSVWQRAARIPRGLPYVLSVLTPPRDERLDPDALASALRTLTGGSPPDRTPGHFEVIAGISGDAPSIYRSADRPFTIHFTLGDQPFTVRMDSWLPVDTFRRPGFGHVLRGREHVQILERGVNLVWLDHNGEATPPLYAASLFALEPSYAMELTAMENLATLGRKSRAIVRLEGAYAPGAARP